MQSDGERMAADRGTFSSATTSSLAELAGEISALVDRFELDWSSGVVMPEVAERLHALVKRAEGICGE